MSIETWVSENHRPDPGSKVERPCGIFAHVANYGNLFRTCADRVLIEECPINAQGGRRSLAMAHTRIGDMSVVVTVCCGSNGGTAEVLWKYEKEFASRQQREKKAATKTDGRSYVEIRCSSVPSLFDWCHQSAFNNFTKMYDGSYCVWLL